MFKIQNEYPSPSFPPPPQRGGGGLRRGRAFCILNFDIDLEQFGTL